VITCTTINSSDDDDAAFDVAADALGVLGIVGTEGAGVAGMGGVSVTADVGARNCVCACSSSLWRSHYLRSQIDNHKI
jgi:hypothetical protein